MADLQVNGLTVLPIAPTMVFAPIRASLDDIEIIEQEKNTSVMSKAMEVFVMSVNNYTA